MSTIVRAILDVTSVAVHRYQALSGVPNSETYTLATAGAVTLTGVGGIALENANPGASFSMQIDGTISSAMGTGNYAFVTTDASGNLTRSDHWAEDCFGVVDTAGVVTLTATGGGGSGSVSPSVVFTAHGVIAQYAAVCSFATGVLQQATPALLLAGAVLVGIAPVAVANGAAFSPTLVGQTLAVAGLGAGGASIVTLNATGGLIAGDFGGYVVGTVDASSVLTVTPSTPHLRAAPDAMALALFGGIPEDWNACVNNNAAWDAMMLAISPFNVQGTPGYPVFIKNKFYFAYTPELYRRVVLHGTGAGSHGPGTIVTPPGMPVLAIDYSLVSPDGGDAAYSTIEHLEIKAESPTITGVRSSAPGAINVTKGQFYSLAGETRYVLLAITTGSTAGSLPATLTPGNAAYAPLGDVPKADGTGRDTSGHVTDGSVTWQWIALSYDKVKAWRPNVQVDVGYQTRLFGDPRYVFTCTTKGWTSDTAAPSAMSAPNLWQIGIAETLSGTQIAASKTAAVWRCEIHCGIACYTICRIQDVFIYGRVAGCGLMMQGGLAGTTFPTVTNNSFVDNLTCALTGGGIYVAGSDANGISLQDLDFTGLGANQDGWIGNGVEDHTSAGVHVSNLYAEGGTGRAAIARSTTGGLWEVVRSENNQPSMYNDPSTVMLASEATGYTRAETVLWINPSDESGATRVLSTAPNVYYNPSAGSGGTWGFRNEGSLYAVQWKYDATSGEWQLGMVPNATSAPAAGLTAADSGSLANLWRVGAGQFQGVANKVFAGFDLTLRDSNSVRGGARSTGDEFVINDSVGQPRFSVCVTPGQSGPVWPGVVVTKTDNYYDTYGRSFATTWNDNGTQGFGWKCTRTGTTGAVPDASAVAGSNANAPRLWTASTRVHPSEYFRPLGTDHSDPTPSGGNGHQYKPYLTDWAPSTTYTPNAVVSIPGANIAVVNYVTKFVPSNVGQVGEIYQPTSGASPAYGRAFQIIAQTDGAGTVTSTAFGGAFVTTSTEPTWPIDGVSTVDSGTARYQEVTLKSNATAPQWRTKYNSSIAATDRSFDGTLQTPINWRVIALTTNASAQPTFATGAGSFTVDNAAAKYPGDDAFGLTWVEAGAENANSRFKSGTAEFTRVNIAPDYGVYGRMKHQGVISTAVAGNIALNIDFANYEAVKLTGAGGFTVTVSNLIVGNRHTIINTCAAAVTLLPGTITLATGEAADFFCDGTTLYKLT